jgi:hypothetical protein
MESESSLQEHADGPYPEPDEYKVVSSLQVSSLKLFVHF